jgi:hypothetical protein
MPRPSVVESPRARHRGAVGALALVALVALPMRHAHAQGGHVHGGHAAGPGASGAADSTQLAQGAAQAMSAAAGGHDDRHAMAHLRMTPVRTAAAVDSARAAHIVTTLRASMAKYHDVRRAEADGYALFAPELKAQRIYHYTRRRSAIAAAFRFDQAQPTSLLYVKRPDGTMRLHGAMYTAPKRAAPEQLDHRVPLSMARWHRHVDICVPKKSERSRWTEVDSAGVMRFGPAGSIVTESACDVAKGRWIASLFGWMVHVNAWADDPRQVFESH